jgi:hypothetical protein
MKRKQLGRTLPAVKTSTPPTPEDIDRAHAIFDSTMPEWAGLLDPKPKGTTPAPRFYRDEITGVVTRARDGHVVTNAERRMIMDEFTKRVRK